MMVSALKVAANRRNAFKSTGPRTRAGKARVRRNARRHGLRTPLVTDLVFAPHVEELARRYTGGDERPAVLACARLAAEAALELERVRQARRGLINAGVRGEGGSPDLRTARAIRRQVQMLTRFERYEARAFGRRQRMLRMLRRAFKDPDAFMVVTLPGFAGQSQMVVARMQPGLRPGAIRDGGAAREADPALRSAPCGRPESASSDAAAEQTQTAEQSQTAEQQRSPGVVKNPSPELLDAIRRDGMCKETGIYAQWGYHPRQAARVFLLEPGAALPSGWSPVPVAAAESQAAGQSQADDSDAGGLTEAEHQKLMEAANAAQLETARRAEEERQLMARIFYKRPWWL